MNKSYERTNLVDGIQGELTINDGLLLINEKRLEAESEELAIIADNCWDRINEEVQSKIIEAKLKKKFLNALKYNFYLNFEESEKNFFYSSPADYKDYLYFMKRSFKWSNSSSNSQKINFLNWYKLIFGRSPMIDCKKIFSHKYLKVKYFDTRYYHNTFCELSFDSNDKSAVELYSLNFQYEFWKLELNINSGIVYIIDGVYYCRNKRIFTEEDVNEWTPIEYVERLEDLEVWHIYVREVFKYYQKMIIPGNLTPYDYYKKFTEGHFLNLAEFMYKSFHWSTGEKGFKWWYKTVFGNDFHYEGYGLTDKDVQNRIKEYEDNDGHSRKYDGWEEDSYTERDSFLDAYSDGFSRAESDFYYNSDDSDY